jgi:hypothetical protein
MRAETENADAVGGEVIPPTWRTPCAAEAEAMAADIIAANAELIQGMRTTVDKAVVVGLLLLQAKSRWRGEWLIWLESNTPIMRRTAAFYIELATARETLGGSRDWKRVSNLGVAGAVAELRTRRRKATAAADRSAPVRGTAIVTKPALAPPILAHPVALLAELLLHTVRTCSASMPELTSGDVLAALNHVSSAIRDNGLDAPPRGLGA